MREPRRLRVAIIAPARFPIADPFIGGLEAQVWLFCRTLRARGHRVTLFAAPGSDRRIANEVVYFDKIPTIAVAGRADISNDKQLLLAEDRAYDRALSGLISHGSERFDVIHNHSLHPAPVALAATIDVPMVTTLHTPPLDRVLQARAAMPYSGQQFVAVSAYTAASWNRVGLSTSVVLNGVDVQRWRPGSGGSRLIWSGRLVAEKGADLAIDAARRSGLGLDLAGPIIDSDYFDDQIRPRLGGGVRYLGHLNQRSLAVAVARARAALVTPRWDEPFGLVVAESLACATPVLAFGRGGIPEILTPDCGELVTPDDVTALAAAARRAAGLSRKAARLRAVQHCSATTMIESYEAIYRNLIAKEADGESLDAAAALA